MLKHQKYLLVALCLMALVSVPSVFAEQSCVFSGHCHTATAYDLQLPYPDGWKQAPYDFYVTAHTKQSGGLFITSNDTQISIAVAPKYTGDVTAEHGAASVITKTEAMLLSSTALPSMPGVSDIQWIVSYASDFTAMESLVSTEQLSQLHLVPNKMVSITDQQMLFRPTGQGQEISAGFNSQEPLTLDQAIIWLQKPNTKVAHAILLSARAKN